MLVVTFRFRHPFLVAYRGTPTSSFSWSALLVAGSRTLVWLVANLCQWAPAALGFPPCAVLFFWGLRFWAASPAAGGLPVDSATVCLACLCASGLGWAATLPLCSQCFSCAGWPAGVHWVSSPCVWELSWWLQLLFG